MAIVSTRPTIALIRTRWRKKGARSIAERASVIGANLWKIAVGIFKHLETEGFRFPSDRLATAVIAEFAVFLIHLVDRGVYGLLKEDERAEMVGAVAGHVASAMEDNQRDLLGPGDYRAAFVALLNKRAGEYAEFEFQGGEPGYSCLRYFAGSVAEAVAEVGDKWLLEQILDIEAPEMLRLVKKLVDEVAPAEPA